MIAGATKSAARMAPGFGGWAGRSREERTVSTLTAALAVSRTRRRLRPLRGAIRMQHVVRIRSSDRIERSRVSVAHRRARLGCRKPRVSCAVLLRRETRVAILNDRSRGSILTFAVAGT